MISRLGGGSKKAVFLTTTFVALVISLSAVAFSPLILAASDAYFSLSPQNGNYAVGSTLVLEVSETSNAADGTNAAQVDLSYPTDLLTFQAISLTGPFTLCAQQTGGGGSVEIGCASPNKQSGTQSIAAVSFNVIGSGAATIKVVSGSDIDNTEGKTVWNRTLADTVLSLGGTQNSTPTKPSTSFVSLGSLSVTVSSTNGKRLTNAKVILDNGKTETTDQAGVVNFSGITSGNHQLSITVPGQKSLSTTVNLKPGENKLVSIKLTPKPTVLWPIILIIVGLVVIVLLIVSFSYQRLPKKRHK